MSESQDWIKRRAAVVARGIGQFAGDTTARSAKGALVIDADGRELLDLTGGIGVMNVGHCDERVVAAIQKQAALLLHASFNVATYEPYLDLCEKLVELLPHGGPTKVALFNSGSEAVENAVKVARQATGRPGIMCFTEAFHGRTLMSMTLTSKTAYKTGCGPFAPEVHRLQFPSHFHYGQGQSLSEFVDGQLAALDEAFIHRIRAQDLAAVIMEPVLGEGGFVPVPEAYLRGLRERCDAEGILLILDEVQSGFGRTGRWGAFQHYGIVPDLSTWAKSMGGGLPISALMGKAEVMDAALPGTIGGTYGGNPVACAAALATIETMQTLDLNARGEYVGSVIRERFERLRDRSNLVADVRGLGAMVGLELCHDRDPDQPAGEAVEAITSGCRKRGVLVLPAGTNGNVLRVLSPLVISDADLNRGLDAIEDSLLEFSGQSKVQA